MKNADYKSIILSIVRSNPRGQTTIQELNKDLQTTAYMDLQLAADCCGFDNIIEYLESLSDVLKLQINGARTVIEAVPDHIAEMNRYSKKSSFSRTKRSFKRQMDYEYVQELFQGENFDNTSEIESVHEINAKVCLPKFHKIQNNLEKQEHPGLVLPIQNLQKLKFRQKMLEKLQSDSSKKDEDTVKSAAKLKLNRLVALQSDVVKLSSQQNAVELPQRTFAQNMTSELNFVKTSDRSFPKCINIQFGPENNQKSIIILQSVTPHRFWFCENSDYDDYKLLRTQMFSFYKENFESFKIDANEMKNGLGVAVCHKNGWRRAKVLKYLYGTLYRVLLVDYGSVVDVDLSNFRYLKEDFMQYPILARRGVLAYVQPKYKYWSNEANQFFYKKVEKQRVDAKIYRTSMEDSYYMSIKVKGELPASALIIKDFAKKDNAFLFKDPINANIMSFDDFENGKYAEISNAAALQACDSWIPKVNSPIKSSNGSMRPGINENERLNQQRSAVSGNKSVNYASCPSVSTSFHEKSPKKYQLQNSVPQINNGRVNMMNRNLQMWTRNPFRRGPRIEVQLNRSSTGSTIIASSLASSPEKEKVIEVIKWQIEPQRFENMAIDREASISIHCIEKSNMFYFYNIEELSEFCNFNQEFNKSYKHDKQYQARSEIKLEQDVAVFHDLNYCRGRVISQKSQQEFEIFLLDYGIITSRRVKDIFYLNKEFMHRQAAVYKGTISKEQTKLLDKNVVNQILLGLKDKAVTALIVSISDNGIIELKLNKIGDLSETH